MFPTVLDDTTQQENSEQKKPISTSAQLADVFLYNWDKKEHELVDGTVKIIHDIEAIKQWIVLFIKTPRGKYRIYEGTYFGTSIRKLFGRKRLNNGYEESQVEREIKEGLPLCPAIRRVSGFNMKKEGKNLLVYVQAELHDGTLVNVTVDDIYIIW